jgi:uncharacterized protein YoaH (UPF0181 family)
MLGASAQSLSFQQRDALADDRARTKLGGRGGMDKRIVTLRLNQQQLELIDRTVSQGAAAGRAALVRRALREQYAKANARPEAKT